jgi:hypothetical protein
LWRMWIKSRSRRSHEIDERNICFAYKRRSRQYNFPSHTVDEHIHQAGPGVSASYGPFGKMLRGVNDKARARSANSLRRRTISSITNSQLKSLCITSRHAPKLNLRSTSYPYVKGHPDHMIEISPGVTCKFVNRTTAQHLLSVRPRGESLRLDVLKDLPPYVIRLLEKCASVQD